MYYTIYKITNIINGKFYIGSHRTKNINDTYMGSGKLLKRAIEKYGIENFKKEILFVFDNAEEMYAKEKELVNVDFLSEENTYNLKIGGFGGWDYANKPGINITHTKEFAVYRSSLGLEKRISTIKENYKNPIWTKNLKSKISQSKKKYFETHDGPFKGKKHSPDTILKIIKSSKNKGLGSKNSQYGTCWITNGKENKKIKKEDLDYYIKTGYYKGRTYHK